MGDVADRLRENLSQRYRWIWEHDERLEEDLAEVISILGRKAVSSVPLGFAGQIFEIIVI